jgi:hypothetical protein
MDDPREDATDDQIGQREGQPGAGTPTWVKIAAAIGVLILLVVIAVLVFGGGPGGHGPGRHLGGQASAAAASGDSAFIRPAGAGAQAGPPSRAGVDAGLRPAWS